MDFRIILVKPRNPDNIGASARAMANFGLEDLRVVSPHIPVWRESVETLRAAVGAGQDPEAEEQDDGYLEPRVLADRGQDVAQQLKSKRD